MDSLFELEQKLLHENEALVHDQSLTSLRQYKYSSIDRSLLSKYVLNPFWTYCAEFMPPWLAPNCITLIGISAIVFSNLLIVIFQNSDMETPMNRLVYLIFAISLIFYQTMDNIDGKQARKTGTSSPLGELFDHGIDSLNCIWGTLLLVSAFGQGSSIPAVCTIVPPMIAMYLSAWETYYTKTLFLDYFNGPTEGLIVAVVFQLICVFLGPEFWLRPMFWTFGYPLGDAMAITMNLLVLFFHVPGCILNVRRCNPDLLRKRLKNIWPIIAVSFAIFLWTTSPGSVILTGGHLFLFSWALSFTFGRITTTIILSHLCDQEFPRLNFPTMLLFFGTFVYGVLPRVGLGFLAIGELIYIWLYLILAALYFLFFSKLVIDRITQYLGIHAFKIESL